MEKMEEKQEGSFLSFLKKVIVGCTARESLE